MDSRELDRVVAFTDAAVAIALTLLVLPLVDVANEVQGVAVGALWDAHFGQLLAFVLSFFVVSTFWRAHRRLFARLRSTDEALVALNFLWLLGVVFLPVPTAVLTFEADVFGVTLLYLGNLAFVALAGVALSLWAHTHPHLQREDVGPALPRHVRRAVVVAVGLVVVGALAVPFGPYALYGLFALPVLQSVVGRLERS